MNLLLKSIMEQRTKISQHQHIFPCSTLYREPIAELECGQKPGNSHFSAVSESFGRSPKLLTYLASRIPEFSFAARMSHLLRKSTRSTLARSLFEHIAFHRSTESSCGRSVNMLVPREIGEMQNGEWGNKHILIGSHSCPPPEFDQNPISVQGR